MSIQKQRNSLISSSNSINSIRNSVSNFSKGLGRTSLLASGIIEQTRKTNIFTSKLIRKDDQYFNKRRENVRRKQREDELESTSIKGVETKQGNIVQRSTKGFLGRILDFFGIILIGWFINSLPVILNAISSLIKRIQQLTNILTNFVEGVGDFFTSLGQGIREAMDSLPKFDFLKAKAEQEDENEKAVNALLLLNTEFQEAVEGFEKSVDNEVLRSDVNKNNLEMTYGEEIDKAYKDGLQEAKESGAEVEEGVGDVGDATLDGEVRQDDNIITVPVNDSDNENENVVETPIDQEETEDDIIVGQADKIIDDGVKLVNNQKEKDVVSEKDVDNEVKNQTNKLKNTIGDVSKRNQTTNKKNNNTTGTKKRRETVVYRGDQGALKLIKGTGVDALTKEEAISNFLKLKEKDLNRTAKENFRFKSLSILLNDKFGVNTRDIQTNVNISIPGRKDDMGLIVPISKNEQNLVKNKKSNKTTVIIQEVAVNTGNGGSFVGGGGSGIGVEFNTNKDPIKKAQTLILNS